MRRFRARRAFTMVEALVFVPIGLAVMGIVWTLWSSSARKGKATDVKVQSLQENLVVALSLERDLQGIYEDSNHPIRIADDGSALLFSRCADASNAPEWVPLELEDVLYRFDAATGKVMRRIGNGEERAFSGSFELVHFRIENPTEPARSDQEIRSAPAVIFTLVSIPEEDMAKPMNERDATRRTTLVSGVSRRWVASRVSHPFWNPIPYVPPAPAAPTP